MTTPRNVALALAATCWLFTAVVIVQGQRWHNSPNHHRDRGFHDYDGAEDPNAVDDDFGWSWGAAQRPNANNNNVVGGRPQRQRPPTRSPNPAGARTPPPNPTTASQPPVAGTTQPQTDSPSATSVVYSDEFYECMSQCRTTNEWNPVCGSDNNDYNNVEKLNCANSCGGNVQQLRRGPCRPFGK